MWDLYQIMQTFAFYPWAGSDCDDGSESWHALRSLLSGNQETHTENEG